MVSRDIKQDNASLDRRTLLRAAAAAAVAAPMGMFGARAFPFRRTPRLGAPARSLPGPEIRSRSRRAELLRRESVWAL